MSPEDDDEIMMDEVDGFNIRTTHLSVAQR
jgi:hypothetical protein